MTPFAFFRPGTFAGVVGACFFLLVTAVPRAVFAASWEPVGRMAEPRNFPQATLLTDGTVLVTGGSRPLGFAPAAAVISIRSAERFDPQTNRFIAAGPMREGRVGHSAVRLLDGRVLVLGGFDHLTRNSLRSAELYDPVTDAFTLVGEMQAPHEVAVLLWDGRVLVLGGRAVTAEIYDPATRSFRPTGSLARPRLGAVAVALPDGRVAILGGEDDQQRAIRAVEIYDPASGRFTVHGEIAVERLGATATLLPGGKIALAGGVFRSGARGGLTVRNSVEIYDPATGQAAIADRMSTPRWLHAAVALSNGAVLVTGGARAPVMDRALRTAELFDPATGKVSLTEPMNGERWGAALVLLPDGRALVVGGAGRVGDRFTILDSAEVYRP